MMIDDRWINDEAVDREVGNRFAPQEPATLVIAFASQAISVTFNTNEERDAERLRVLAELGAGCDVIGHNPEQVEPLGGELGTTITICGRCKERLDV